MKIKNKILLLVFFLTLGLATNCFALSEGDTISYDGLTTTMPEIGTTTQGEWNVEDPLYVELLNTPAVMSSYTDISEYISTYETGDSVVGIDVSQHQGSIDWEEVANAGVKFVMIRCGYRGYSEGLLYEDPYFEDNIQGALDNGIYVGVYFYSMATTAEEALQEAAYVVSLIQNYEIKYPVAYDFETFTDCYDGTTAYRTNGLSASQMNENALTFLNYIRSQGYTPCIYGSSSYMTSTWNSTVTSAYDVWVAHYDVSAPSYTGDYTMWQCTSSGSVSGISTRVDVNIDYYYYNEYHDIDITDYLFDATYYADRYSDLKKAYGYDETSLKKHYLNCGIKEGRSASPVFDPKYYISNYADLKSAFGTDYTSAYNHFINYGIYEGRQASEYFDVTYYLSTYKDVKKAYYSSKTNALKHFMKFGINEGRIGSSEFNVKTYISSQSSYIQTAIGSDYIKYYAQAAGGNLYIKNTTVNVFNATYYADLYADLKAAFGYNENKLKEHYLTYGIKEGRSASPVFDPKYYLEKYSDLSKAFGTDYTSAYNHFVNLGVYEGRQASIFLDVKYYIESYTDLTKAFGFDYAAAVNHFVSNGISEGRQGSSEFSAKAYINNYTDLKAAFGTNYKSGIVHYVKFGKSEGRTKLV